MYKTLAHKMKPCLKTTVKKTEGGGEEKKQPLLYENMALLGGQKGAGRIGRQKGIKQSPVEMMRRHLRWQVFQM